MKDHSSQDWLQPSDHGDVFPFIINEERSKIPVNAGFQPAKDPGLSEREEFLNRLQKEIPQPWPSVRFDVFTHHYAREYIERSHPKIVYIAYGETDDYAHDGRYDRYLTSAWQSSNFIEDLWKFVQGDTFYQGKTTFVITTDHGLGRPHQWTLEEPWNSYTWF